MRLPRVFAVAALITLNLAIAWYLWLNRPLPDPVERSFAVAVPPLRVADLRYFGNGSLDGSPARRAFILVHGTGFGRSGAASMAAVGERAVRDLGLDETLIVAPAFIDRDEARLQRLAPGVLRWTEGGWIFDDPAAGPAPVPAYSAIAQIVARLADRARFPKMEEIVLAGFSGGGQLVQRYAVVMDAPPGPPVRYVVGSPSSYLYLDDRRPHAGAFAPFDRRACPRFNAWHYGFDGVRGYFGPVAPLIQRYARRRVAYVAGENDVSAESLDTECAAEAQGKTRVERARVYGAYLRSFFPDPIPQTFGVVPGAGHDTGAVFDSQCGEALLSGRLPAACAELRQL